MTYRVVREVDSGTTSTGEPTARSPTVATNGEEVGGRKMDEDEERDAVFYRLEMLGYRVGQGLVERFVSLLCFL